jgi:hypothetical protein
MYARISYGLERKSQADTFFGDVHNVVGRLRSLRLSGMSLLYASFGGVRNVVCESGSLTN